MIENRISGRTCDSFTLKYNDRVYINDDSTWWFTWKSLYIIMPRLLSGCDHASQIKFDTLPPILFHGYRD